MNEITEQAFLDELEKIGGWMGTAANWLGGGARALGDVARHSGGVGQGLRSFGQGVSEAYKAGGGGLMKGLKSVMQSPYGAAIAMPAAGAVGLYGAYRYGKGRGQQQQPMR